MTDVKFEGTIHKFKDGLVAKFDRLNDIAEEHDHSCRPFKTDDAAELWLLDRGVDLEDIQREDHTTPEHAMEAITDLANIVGDAAKAMTEKLEGLNRLNELVPKPYEFSEIQDLERDAFQLMIVLAKYDMPIQPEALEQKLSEQQNA